MQPADIADLIVEPRDNQGKLRDFDIYMAIGDVVTDNIKQWQHA